MNENNQANELTFQKVFEVIKRSFVRIVIYAIVFTILGGGISAAITLATTGDIEYKTIIEYNFQSAENGKDPLGNILDTNKIKSTLIINNALRNMAITDNEEIFKFSNILEDSLTVEGYVSSQMEKEISNEPTKTYHSTRFTVKLAKNGKLPFKNTQYVQFLNELAKSYIEFFADFYDYGKILSLRIADNALEQVNDYIDLIEDYKSEINNLINDLGVLKNNAQERYNKISSNISALLNDLYSIENYILGNNVVKENSPLSINDNLTIKKNNYTQLSTRYRGLAQKIYDEILKDYKISSTTTTDGGLIKITNTESKAYETFVREYNGYRSKEFSYDYEANLIDSKLSILNAGVCTQDHRNAVEIKFADFDSKLDSVIAKSNEELSNYSKVNVLEKGVNIAMPAVKSRTINYTMILIIAIIACFVGCIAAIIVTETKNKKYMKQQKTNI